MDARRTECRLFYYGAAVSIEVDYQSACKFCMPIDRSTLELSKMIGLSIARARLATAGEVIQ